MVAPVPNCFVRACYRFKIAICTESEADPNYVQRDTDRRPCAEYCPRSSPAAAYRLLMTALTLWGSSAARRSHPICRCAETPDRSRFSKIRAKRAKAWTGRPTASALSPASAEEVLVRHSLIGSAGRVGPSGIEGSMGTASNSPASRNGCVAVAHRDDRPLRISLDARRMVRLSG